jgi:hypothetical protein
MSKTFSWLLVVDTATRSKLELNGLGVIPFIVTRASALILYSDVILLEVRLSPAILPSAPAE